MRGFRQQLGAKGEEIATKFLKREGYRIRKRNFRTRFGEIDIIAEKRGVISFIEVKTRQSSSFGTPQDSVTRGKREHLKRSALIYLKRHPYPELSVRFDVIAVVVNGRGKPHLELIENII